MTFMLNNLLSQYITEPTAGSVDHIYGSATSLGYANRWNH